MAEKKFTSVNIAEIDGDQKQQALTLSAAAIR